MGTWVNGSGVERQDELRNPLLDVSDYWTSGVQMEPSTSAARNVEAARLGHFQLPVGCKRQARLLELVEQWPSGSCADPNTPGRDRLKTQKVRSVDGRTVHWQQQARSIYRIETGRVDRVTLSPDLRKEARELELERLWVGSANALLPV